MKSSINTRRGLSITSVIVAVVALGLATGGVVKYVQSTGQYRRQLYTRTQENSYRVFQNEIAVTGANPTAMTHNPLAATLVSRQDGVTGTAETKLVPPRLLPTPPHLASMVVPGRWATGSPPPPPP